MAYDINVTLSKESKLDRVDIENLTFGRTFADHMFEVDFMDGQWQNPRISPLHSLEVHPSNLALHYGQAIFEGMKASMTQDGTPVLYRPELHARRMNFSARRMCMPEIPEDLFLEALHHLVGLDHKWIPRKKGSALYLRPLMFAWDAFLGVKAAEKYKFLVIAAPAGPYYPKPITLWVEKNYIRAAEGGVGQVKAAGNYAAALLPTQMAHKRGYDQVLWLDGRQRKYTQEVGTMNIFFRIGDKVLTPEIGGTILRGITRLSAIEILADKGIEVEERPVAIGEILEAHQRGNLKEVFGTGTAAVVAEVSAIGSEDFEIDLKDRDTSISKMIKSEIDGLRDGTVVDTRGWTVPVEVMQMEEVPS